MDPIIPKAPIYRPFVLSGGGARGYAHLGVLKACAEHHIFPEVIAATSAGSIVSAFICDGYSTEEIREIFRQTKVGLSMQKKNWHAGFLSLQTLEKVLERTLRHTTFEGLKIPLHITATDYNTGAQTIFNKGPLIPAILAASTIPILFPPVEIAGVPYVDGGLSGNMPVEPLLAQYKCIIGVHVNPLAPYRAKGSIMSKVERTLNMAIREPVLKNRPLCSRFIEPDGLEAFRVFDFKRFEAIYKIGLEYTRQHLQQFPEEVVV